MKKELLYQKFSHLPELTTFRLRLRKMMVIDTDDMFEYASQPEVTKYLLWKPHSSRNFTKEYLEYIGKKYRTGSFFDWAIVLENEKKMIGTCGFTSFDCSSDCAEIGYVLNPAYCGNGYATEAVRKIMEFGFKELGLHRIEAKFMEGNERSLHLMQNVGMTFEGYHRECLWVKGNYVTVGVCSILASEYQKN